MVKPLRDTKDGGPISRAPMSDALCNQLVTYTLSHTVAPAPTPGQNCLGPRGGVSLHLPSLTVAQIGLVFRLNRVKNLQQRHNGAIERRSGAHTVRSPDWSAPAAGRQP